MKLIGRYVTVKGRNVTMDHDQAILIRKVTVELPEAVMHKFGSDALELNLKVWIDANGALHERIVGRP